jgi:serine/threonine protein kinase
MPHEKPVNPETLSKKERLDIIRRLPALVRRLHSRNVVHGDIKPSNMLIRPDGDICLCDFANASHTSEKAPATPELSVHYVSAKRFRDYSASATKEQDIYAMGISIWELYVGHVPFCDINPIILPSFIKAGGRPDLSPIDDPKIRSLIIDCLDGVATPYDKPVQTPRVCIRTEMASGNCIANPPHTFHQLYRCFWCAKNNVPPPCPNLFVPPVIVKVSSSSCAKCIPPSSSAI